MDTEDPQWASIDKPFVNPQVAGPEGKGFPPYQPHVPPSRRAPPLASIEVMNVVAAKAGLASRLSKAGIARKVETDLTFAIRESRRRSALAGISRLRAEAAGLGFELASAANAVEVMAAREARRAAAAAKSYARRFFSAAQQSDVQKALDATKGSLRRTAVTESSDAFNAGRKQAVQLVGRQLMRVWDALLDACPVCAAEDGKIVGVSENFSIGEPGSVHPFCRCNWTLVTLEETR